VGKLSFGLAGIDVAGEIQGEKPVTGGKKKSWDARGTQGVDARFPNSLGGEFMRNRREDPSRRAKIRGKAKGSKSAEDAVKVPLNVRGRGVVHILGRLRQL